MIASIYLIAIAFLLGNLTVHQLTVLPTIERTALFLLLPVVLCVFSRCTYLRAIGGFSAGFCLTLASALIHSNDILSTALDHKTVEMSGNIATIPRVNDSSVSFIFKPDDPELPRRVALKVYAKRKGQPPDAQLKVNTRLSVKAKLQQPRGYANPGTFDYERWLFSKRIGARGYVRSYSILPAKAEARFIDIDAIRQMLIDKLYSYRNTQTQVPAITSLGLGFSSALSYEQNDALIATGTRHLFAVSGLHINLVFGFFFIIFRYLWGRTLLGITMWPSQSAGLVGAFPIAVGYALLTGLALPTQRALIALFCIVAMHQLRKVKSPGQVLCVVLLAILIYDPLSTLSLSFWLSFGAVSLIVFYIFTGTVRSDTAKWKRFILFQVYLSCTMALLGMLLFSRGSLTAIVANLFAVPYIGFVILPLNLLTVAMVAINDTVGLWILTLTDALFNGFWYAIGYFERYGIEWYRQPPLWTFAFALGGILLFKFLPDRYYRFLSLLLCIPLAVNHNAHFDELNPQDFSVSFMDVGQGLSVIVKTANHQLVYDVGPQFRSGFNTASAVLIPHLRSLGMTDIDTLVISHNDNDHAGGTKAFLKDIKVKRILSGEPFADSVEAEPCHYGQNWVWDQVRFSVLYPAEGLTKRGNDASCVVRIDNGRHSVLLTGDIEKSAERILVSTQRAHLKSDVLSVPHHGSNTSSSLRFIRAVSAPIAVVASGYKNPYQFPTDKVVKRYQSQNTRLYNTALKGMVKLIFNQEGIAISAWRDTYHHYWHHTTTSSPK